jgi:hypothetical protein
LIVLPGFAYLEDDCNVSTFTYDDASRLTGLAHDLAGGSANDQSFAFAYTDASQLAQRITSNGRVTHTLFWTSDTHFLLAERVTRASLPFRFRIRNRVCGRIQPVAATALAKIAAGVL